MPGEGRADIAPPSGPIILKKFLFLFVISLIFNRGGKFPQGIQFLPGGGGDLWTNDFELFYLLFVIFIRGGRFCPWGAQFCPGDQ